MAVGTLFLLGPIFLHHHTRRRQIQDLTPLFSTGCHRVQVLLASLSPFSGNSMISSGVDENCKLDPRCPGCPPDFLPLGLRASFSVPAQSDPRRAAGVPAAAYSLLATRPVLLR